MDAKTRTTVRARAQERCEYCHIHQQFYRFTFHIEHIIAKQHQGTDEKNNLALACHHCNRHKGPNLAGIDLNNGKLTPLFHPRQDTWLEHFSIQDGQILGLTDIGRTTVQVLNMNAVERVRLRILLEPGYFSPNS